MKVTIEVKAETGRSIKKWRDVVSKLKDAGYELSMSESTRSGSIQSIMIKDAPESYVDHFLDMLDRGRRI